MSKYFSSYLGSQRSSLGSKMFWRVVIQFFAIKSRGGKCNEDLDGAYDPTLSR